jgi:16S rRNA (cytidine1402-2'-O)-methyltransferase
VLSALAVSGLPTDRFAFDGFLPRKSGERRKAFENLLTETRTVIFFESPHRILESLQDAVAVLGPDRRASVSRELTKKFEQTIRGTLAELVAWADGEIKGEIVLVIAGAKPATATIEDLVPVVLAQRAAGLSLKQAVAEVASAHNVSKSDLYQRALDAKADPAASPLS